MKKISNMISLQHFMKNHINDIGYYELKARYEAFLNKEVKKGMFVPCDDKDKLIGKNVSDNNYQGVLLYQQARKRILFEGWEYDSEEEVLKFKIDDTSTYFLDFEDIQNLTLRKLILEELKLSKIDLKEIYNVTNAKT